MIKKIFALATIALFISCKNDVKTDVIAEDTATQENNSVTNADQQTDVTTTAPSINGENSNVGQNPPVQNNGSVTNTAPTVSTTVPTTTVPTTAAQKNAAPKSTDDVSVKYGKNKQSETRYSIDPDEPDPIKVANLPIPDPCNLLSESFVKNTLKLKYNPEKKQGSFGGKGYEKSCFWRIDDELKPNAGIMLQVMINPYSNDVDDFPSLVINSKIKDGEMSPQSPLPTKYLPWNDVSAGGCYSYQAGKYHWKVGKKYVFMLAFNASHSEAQQKQIATLLAKEILSNYKF